jgi:hypothetical protein
VKHVCIVSHTNSYHCTPPSAVITFCREKFYVLRETRESSEAARVHCLRAPQELESLSLSSELSPNFCTLPLAAPPNAGDGMEASESLPLPNHSYCCHYYLYLLLPVSFWLSSLPQ